MEDLDYINKINNQIITIDNINRTNDCFLRYLFSDAGSENIVLNFINAVMKNLNFVTFSKIEILNPFNLAKYLQSKESIMDIKCSTESGEIVLIEIQLQGNREFIYRTLFYWANRYSVLLNKGENYNKLHPVISINILDFKLIDVIDDIHTCYVLKEIKHNNILTDHCQFHFIELPKFKNNHDNNEMKKEFLSWIKFFKGDKMDNLLKENTVFEQVKLKSESFLNNNPLTDTYRRKEIDEYFNKRMLDYELNEAERKGIEKGKTEQQITIAKNLKTAGIDIKIISENTGLSIEEIEKL